MVLAVENVIGAGVHVSESRRSDVIDPRTEEVWATAPLSDELEVANAISEAQRGFGLWSRFIPKERAGALLDLADGLLAHAEELIELDRRNTGASAAFVRHEILDQAVDAFRYFAGCARVATGPAAGEYVPGFTSYVRREPMGVCAAIGTWNYPLSNAAWLIAPALAAGNSVVFKPARTTPVTAARLAELALDYLPAGALNVVCGAREVTEALVSHPGPRLISFTGSTDAGRRVAEAAARTLKRSLLSLGGKAAAIVFEDADVALTARGIVEAGFLNAGQDCTAASRVLVHESLAGELTDAIVHEARSVPIFGPDCEDGLFPVATAAQLERMCTIVSSLPPHARVLTGGAQAGGTGYFFKPTVIGGLVRGDALTAEEVFGPIITIESFATEDEAISRANEVLYGIAGSIWTRDQGRAARIVPRLDAGSVWVNTHARVAMEMPHVGYKESGDGVQLSMHSYEDFTRVKHVMAALGPTPPSADSHPRT
jgi:betaine-aldehyde dehydrogenase